MRASYIYTLFELFSYVILIYLIITRTFFLILALLTASLAFKICKGVIKNSDKGIEKLLPYLGLNIKLVFVKFLLISISLIIYKITI